MRQVIEGIMVMVFVMLLFFTGMDLLMAHLYAGGAKDYRNQVVSMITQSDYDKDVINECFREARKRGYEMTITLYDEMGNQKEIVDTMDEEEELVEMASVQLRYEIGIPILHKTMQHEIVATT
ncbi:MAG: hypothetical protein K6A30_01895 [Lachnospiraceae bacterium]|nr:hypothetical protein [Lachnospiraceae bacterium]